MNFAGIFIIRKMVNLIDIPFPNIKHIPLNGDVINHWDWGGGGGGGGRARQQSSLIESMLCHVGVSIFALLLLPNWWWWWW